MRRTKPTPRNPSPDRYWKDPFDIIIPSKGKEEGWSHYYLETWDELADKDVQSDPALRELMNFIKAKVKDMLQERQTCTTDASIPIHEAFEYKTCIRKIFSQCLLTHLHLEECFNNQDWLSDIKDYIQYNCESFGHPPTGATEYLDTLAFYFQRVEISSPTWIWKQTQVLSTINSIKVNLSTPPDPLIPTILKTIED